MRLRFCHSFKKRNFGYSLISHESEPDISCSSKVENFNVMVYVLVFLTIVKLVENLYCDNDNALMITMTMNCNHLIDSNEAKWFYDKK